LSRVKTIDILAGGFVVLIGVLAIVESTHFDMGTSRRIGPGYFPFYVGLLMAILGLAIALEGLWTRAEGFSGWHLPPLRSPFLILAAVLCFATMIERFGMLPAIGLGVFISSLADTKTSIWQKLAISLAVPLVSVAIFKYGLSLNVDVIRWRP
jgi:Tripartite tricarboxylate transporter TctB family.